MFMELIRHKNTTYVKIIPFILFNLSVFTVYFLYTQRLTLNEVLPHFNYKLPASWVNKVTNKMPIKYISRIDFDWLSKNPIYSNFKINQTKTKKRVTVLVIVSTAPRRVDRRNAIRATWWKLCRQTGEVR